MLRISIISGGLASLATTIYGIISKMTDGAVPVKPAIFYIVLFAGIFASHYYYKKKNNTMTYGQGVKLGVMVSFIDGLISYLYAFFSDKNMLNNLITNSGSFGKEIINPLYAFLFMFIMSLIYGLIFSSIVSIFTKNTSRES